MRRFAEYMVGGTVGTIVFMAAFLLPVAALAFGLSKVMPLEITSVLSMFIIGFSWRGVYATDTGREIMDGSIRWFMKKMEGRNYP